MSVSGFWTNTTTHAYPIVPSDSAQLLDGNNSVISTRYIYVGGAGNVTLKTDKKQGSAVTFPAVPVGTLLPIETSQVLATGTTATNLVALY